MSIKMLFSIVCLTLLPISTYAQHGIYVTLGGGIAKQSGLPNALDVGALHAHSSLLSAYRFGLGYNHDISLQWGIGLDMAYAHYGNETYHYAYTKTHVYSRSLEFLAMTQIHLEAWDLLVKLGGIRHTVRVTGHDAQAMQTQIDGEIAMGLAYNMNAHFGFIIDLAHIFGQEIEAFDSLRNKTPSLNTFLIGLRYRF